MNLEQNNKINEIEYNQENNIKKCKFCQSDISVYAKICPHCRKRQKSIIPHIFSFIFIIIFFYFIFGGNISNSKTSETTWNTNTELGEIANVSNDTDLSSQPDGNKQEISDNDKQEISKNNNSITMGEKNALKKAKSYLEIMSFSKKELIEQLEYEGFTNKESLYAVENCGANWNEQAKNKAKSYLNITSFSKKGLIEQLEYDGFTHEQAVYGVEANGY